MVGPRKSVDIGSSYLNSKKDKHQKLMLGLGAGKEQDFQSLR